MATKYYGIKDNWTDDDVANVIEVASEDGSVSSVKVNGVEYGGGGGGGDLAIASVTLALEPPTGITIVAEGLTNCRFNYPDPESDNNFYSLSVIVADNHIGKIVLYKGQATIGDLLGADADNNTYSVDRDTISTSGGVTYDSDNDAYYVTGDGTITAQLASGGN